MLVLNNRVIGTGYNGTPADFDNCRDGGCLRCSEHFKKGEMAAEGATYESPHQPCFSCLKESIQAGVTRIVYLAPWYGAKDKALRDQYDRLADLLSPVKGGDAFHRLDAKLYEEFRKDMPTALDDLKPDSTPDPAMGSGA